MPERNADEPPPLDGYVWAALPIEDAVRVRCGMTGIMADAAPATVTFPGSGEDAKEGMAGGGADWLMLTIADMANLTKTYPSECRFLIASSMILSNAVFPWKRTECSRESGQPFPVEVTPALHFEVVRFRDFAYLDITAFVRSDAAAAPCAGVLHLTPFPQPDNGELTWRSPHLLVVGDMPPDDL